MNSLMNISLKARSQSLMGMCERNRNGKVGSFQSDVHDRNILSQVDPEDIQRMRESSELIHSLRLDDILDIFTCKCQDNQIEYIAEQAMTFILKFKKTSRKRCLRLNELQLGSRSAELIAEILQENSYFSQLYLEKNIIGNSGTMFLSQMLRVNKSIIHLDLSGNNIGPEGFEVLFRGLIENQTLISLDVSSKDGLNRNRIGMKGAQQLENLLRFNTCLSFLNLASTQLSLEQICLIMRGLHEGKSLTSLDISSNDLDSACAQQIVNNIMHTPLLELNLAHNLINNNGLAHLQDIGSHCKNYQLETLDLSDNLFNSKGVSLFFDCLHKNITIRKLIFNDNNFSGTQIHKISDFLQDNACVTYLSLERCQIPTKGIECIALGIEKNKTLTHLLLKENLIRNSGAKSLSEALNHKTSLQVYQFITNIYFIIIYQYKIYGRFHLHNK